MNKASKYKIPCLGEPQKLSLHNSMVPITHSVWLSKSFFVQKNTHPNIHLLWLGRLVQYTTTYCTVTQIRTALQQI